MPVHLGIKTPKSEISDTKLTYVHGLWKAFEKKISVVFFFFCGQRRGKLEAREEVAEVTGAFIQWDTQQGWTLGPYEYYQRLPEGPVG